MSKADQRRRRRNKKKAKTPATAPQAPVMGVGSKKAAAPASASSVAVSDRVTPEREGQGIWAFPKGALKSQQPIVDMASDMIGRLHCAKWITDAQEQAARHWQNVRAQYLAELPEVSGYKSCLAGNVPGYDDGDGDPVIIAEYRALEVAMGIAGRREVLRVAEDNQFPARIEVLRDALDAIS